MSDQQGTNGQGAGIVRGPDGQVILRSAAGKEYVLESMTRADLRAAEAHLLSQRQDPLYAIQARMQDLAAFPALQAEFLDRAWKDMKTAKASRTVSAREVKEWLDSFDGTVWTFARTLRRRYPEITEEQVADLIEEVGMAEAQKARDRAAATLVSTSGVGGEPGDGKHPKSGG